MLLVGMVWLGSDLNERMKGDSVLHTEVTATGKEHDRWRYDMAIGWRLGYISANLIRFYKNGYLSGF